MKEFSKIVIANWKMKLALEESVSLAKELAIVLEKTDINDKKVVLCPNFLAIAEVAKVLDKTQIALGSQDIVYPDSGEFSAGHLKELNCQYVIVGHSDRRALGETDDLVNKKVKAVLKEKMVPVICVGETMVQRDNSQSEEVVLRQIEKATDGLDSSDYFILAYEPVWSISTSGSGKVIDAQEAARMLALIKNSLHKKFNNFLLLYGGSVDQKSVAEFSKLEGVEGVLVGAASLKADTFVELIKNS
jgi:triosephosphate isomerase